KIARDLGITRMTLVNFAEYNWRLRIVLDYAIPWVDKIDGLRRDTVKAQRAKMIRMKADELAKQGMLPTNKELERQLGLRDGTIWTWASEDKRIAESRDYAKTIVRRLGSRKRAQDFAEKLRATIKHLTNHGELPDKKGISRNMRVSVS